MSGGPLCLTPLRAKSYDGARRQNNLMMGLGVSELLIILVIVVVLFGASRLPQIGKGLGEGISNFKRSIKSGQDTAEDESKTKS